MTSPFSSASIFNPASMQRLGRLEAHTRLAPSQSQVDRARKLLESRKLKQLTMQRSAEAFNFACEVRWALEELVRIGEEAEKFERHYLTDDTTAVAAGANDASGETSPPVVAEAVGAIPQVAPAAEAVA